MRVYFDVLNIYYIPQYLPIYYELEKRGHDCCLVISSKRNPNSNFERKIRELNLKACWVFDKKEAKELYVKDKPEWIFFGNSNEYLDEIHQHSKTAQLGHGIGPKPSYYHKSKTPMTVRFIEGALRLKKIKTYYPNDTFVQTGFSKLDPLFNDTEKGIDLSSVGLDPDKRTILYAPTFNPSSIGVFPQNWPNDFKAYNILIKVHAFIFSLDRYKKEQSLIEKWSKFPNVYLAKPEEFSLLPFLKSSDILISEASSTLFEFAALNKPVIICDFYDLRWSYKGIFKYRFNKRFMKDNVIYNKLGVHATKYMDLIELVPQQLQQPEEYQDARLEYNYDHVGPTDGKVSERIVDYLEKHN